jgi:hypothetical protein
MNERWDELMDTDAMVDPETSRALRFHHMFHGIMCLIFDHPADASAELQAFAGDQRRWMTESEPGEVLEWHRALAELAEHAREIALRRAAH